MQHRGAAAYLTQRPGPVVGQLVKRLLQLADQWHSHWGSLAQRYLDDSFRWDIYCPALVTSLHKFQTDLSNADRCFKDNHLRIYLFVLAGLIWLRAVDERALEA
ncbi:hypothetical protein S40288_11274 [Stachybotrys chartarum IBT 40288]|nr:hypothetical protein S40288_11274 [Stachybotrys chartarum IBT 40288]